LILTKRIAVIGAGSWGTALAIMAARQGHDVRLWARNQSMADSINLEHRNCQYFNEAIVPPGVVATTDLLAAVENAGMVVLAAPSHALRQLVSQMKSALRSETIVISAAKGIETDTGKRISEVVREVSPPNTFVCLSGPSFAHEVVANHPTAVVAASADAHAGTEVQTALSSETFRIYTNNDVVGTELGGSIKNVMAIAAGMVAGLGFGANSVAALITRGLAEMSRLARHEGAEPETLMGLAGLGDLVLTCTGSLSRNRFVGEQLGKGKKLADIVAEMNEVAEGVKTTLAVERLAHRAGVDMPITHEVHAVLYEGKPASEAATELMTRPLRAEHN
jgi:glycerol-3-phosphate dehydrogenase (NAD(P)+)